jgi:nucleotide-binding universal stress UspA family protein
MISTILVPVNFSGYSDNAVKYAVSLAQQFNSRLHFLHVFTIPVAVGDMPTLVVPIGDFEAAANAQLEEMVKKLIPAGVQFQNTVLAGYAEDEILNYGTSIKADLLVTGTHKSDGFITHLFGNTVTSLIKEIQIPILLIPEHATYHQYKNVAIALDYKSEVKSEVLSPLLKILPEDHEVLILHVDKEDRSKEVVGKQVGSFQAGFTNANFKLQHILNDDIDEGIVSFCNDNKVDLLVTFPHKHSFFERLFHNSHSKNITLTTDLPVLFLPGM